MRALRLVLGICILFAFLYLSLNAAYAQEQEPPPPEPQAETSAADLQLMERTLEFSAPTFKAGKAIKIAVKVKNTGRKKLAPVEVAFWADEEMIGEARIGGLAPGEKQRLTIWWTPSAAGTYTIYAILDPHKRFEESDEGNNRDSRQITIED